jgi:rhamnosyltransferase
MPLRLAIVAHYDEHGLADEYFLHYLRRLSVVARDVVVVSTAALRPEEEQKIRRIATDVVVRENVGYDFLSWRVGLERIATPEIYDEIVICNDSVYGPVQNLSPIFSAMRRAPCEVWGMSENLQFAPHLQSYFLVFKKDAILSPFFEDFWRSVSPQASKQEVIFKYELGLSRRAREDGLRLLPAFRPRPLRVLARASLARAVDRVPAARRLLPRWSYGGGYSQRALTLAVNHTHLMWDDLLAQGFPFVKIELLRKNPHGVSLERVASRLRATGGYDFGLIERHLRRVGTADSWLRAALDRGGDQRTIAGQRETM